MEHQQEFSPGLLYSVAPENFSELHLQDQEEFAREEQESSLTNNAVTKYLWAFLKSTTGRF